MPTGLRRRPETPELTGSRTERPSGGAQACSSPPPPVSDGDLGPHLPIAPGGEVSNSPATSGNLQFCPEPGGRSMRSGASQNRSALVDTLGWPDRRPEVWVWTRWGRTGRGLQLHPHTPPCCTELWAWLRAWVRENPLSEPLLLYSSSEVDQLAPGGQAWRWHSWVCASDQETIHGRPLLVESLCSQAALLLDVRAGDEGIYKAPQPRAP